MAPTSSTRKRGGLHSFRSNRQHGQRRRNQRPFNSNSSSRRDGIASSARECSVVAYTENSNSGILDRLSQIQGNRGQQDQDDENEELCHVVMAIDMKEAATVGCCYYIADEQKLYLLEDITSGGLEAIEALKLDVEPTLVLLSTRADQNTSSFGRNGQDGHAADNDDQFKLPYHLDVRPVQEFNFEGAKLKLANLRPDTSRDDTRFLVPGDTFSPSRNGDENDLGFTDHQGKLLHLSGSIDMDNHISIGCAGALITHLQRKLAAECLAREGAGDKLLNIKSVEMRTLKDTMFVNTDTLTSLQIIQSESHPNVFNQGPGKNSPGAKESLSIYGLFHHFARTPQGRARLRQRFLRPSTDEAHIKEGHDFISTYLRPDNSEAIEKLTKSLKGIKNLRPVMVHVQKGISSGNAKFKAFKSGVWATLLEVCTWESWHVGTREARRDCPTPGGRIIHETGVMSSFLIRSRSIYKSSIEEHRTVVKPRVDPELDDLKETYNGLDSLLNQVAINIAGTIPSRLSNDVNVIYFPQLGFNIAMPLDERGRPVYDGGEKPWEQGASLYKLVRPQMMQHNSIVIKGGRHLLHEVTVPTFIPNDTLIVGGNGRERSPPNTSSLSLDTSVGVADTEGPSMILLTGPNYSGKSVYLKQAQSSFMIDLQQVSFALVLATERSLVIIDEFGKGTESTGLACGLFEYLLSQGEKRPKVLAATHFHEIFENGFLPPRKELGFGYMEVQIDPAARDMENEVTYLYKLRTPPLFRCGRSNASFGTNCALLSGIDPAIISRANEIGTLAARGEDLVVICAKMSVDEIEELGEAESMARRFLGADFSRQPNNSGVDSGNNNERPEVLLENIISKGYDNTVVIG
ncbi:hypothetical protein HCAG_01787 [Histoplasma mississippiense (nom. inval.)]|uniref:hypothetical protein n=1 Tax=Ajellomyces capsulatus (strain NAm1 / WU24) TaxID=2059318 RepID=UPI000157B7EC|nr:hypothetical protein HCAG_01787 [Histoplasma mississippiense (nom. inval.)]EDN03922.1 hypothetical protein HCAG_01787 [Histoplasma mississippiense (nom. inval.)]